MVRGWGDGGEGRGGGGKGGGGGGGGGEREMHLLDMVDRWLQWSVMRHHEGQGSKMSLPGIARFHRQAE